MISIIYTLFDKIMCDKQEDRDAILKQHPGAQPIGKHKLAYAKENKNLVFW